ncbi:MAG: putative immunity protein [Patescibacteria group bacterium]
MELKEPDHASIALRAADCAERVLPYFEKKRPKDDRPREAIKAARAWVRGTITVGEARTASHAPHAAAYAVKTVNVPNSTT